MKNDPFSMKLLVIGALTFATVISSSVRAEEESLENKLGDLSLPANVAPAGITQEKLYSVQSRYSSLRKRSEISVGYAKNFSGSSLLNMTELDASYRYHFNDRWHAAVSGAYGFNSMTGTARTLYQTIGAVNTASYVKNRFDLLAGFNLFYGKFRVSMDKVMYFDQYIAIGPGMVTTQYGTSTGAVADVGLVFWMGRNASFHLGLKNDFYSDKSPVDPGFTHHMLGHLDIGYAFGSGEKI